MALGRARLPLLLVCVAVTWAARPDLLNICMDAKHHKTKPGPEDGLHEQVGQGVGAWGGQRCLQKHLPLLGGGRGPLSGSSICADLATL